MVAFNEFRDELREKDACREMTEEQESSNSNIEEKQFHMETREEGIL